MDKRKLAHTIPEACECIGIGRSMFYEMLKRGEIRSFRIGNRRLVTDEELQSLVERKSRESAA